jgi:hypothetical protein
MKRTINIVDYEEIIENSTIEVEFPFYAKQERRYTNWKNQDEPGELYKICYLKFYDECRHVEIEVPVLKKEENIKLRFVPNAMWMTEGDELNYNSSYAAIIKTALYGEETYKISTEEEFEINLKLYKDQINIID